MHACRKCSSKKASAWNVLPSYHLLPSARLHEHFNIFLLYGYKELTCLGLVLPLQRQKSYSSPNYPTLSYPVLPCPFK